MAEKIAYEKHPVTPERKKELREKGYKIIDIQFAPDAYKAAMKGVDDPRSREALDAALAALPGDQTDPDYVVGGMRSHFGDVFTQEDEARVREMVKVAVKKPSHGLRIDDIKAKLTEKSIAFNPEAERGDLAKLLDEAE
ncbi:MULTISPECIES: hypothetical protein [Pseudomonas]|uniref:hypothetical protein n=1 Tax=Pseudomonas TaxID=286 RepID=UPI001AEAF022|nr:MULTISPECIES: hypothetical protein [Pseudomonas]MBP2091688.1 hypothetical protein [Pseudomonas sp. PvP088]MBP2222149.1 hypothetical protein [Pseudomonas putida]